MNIQTDTGMGKEIMYWKKHIPCRISRLFLAICKFLQVLWSNSDVVVKRLIKYLDPALPELYNQRK
jgi:hypothetical protein